MSGVDSYILSETGDLHVHLFYRPDPLHATTSQLVHRADEAARLRKQIQPRICATPELSQGYTCQLDCGIQTPPLAVEIGSHLQATLTTIAAAVTVGALVDVAKALDETELSHH